MFVACEQELQRQQAEKKQQKALQQKAEKASQALLVNKGGKARPKMSFGLTMNKKS